MLFDSLDEYNLAHIKIDIFLLLDYPSLYIARQVSKGWRDFIDQEIWSVRKSHAMRLFAKEWRENEPTQRILKCPGHVRDIMVDNKIVLAKTIKKTFILDILTGKSVGVLDGIKVLNDSIIHGCKDISSKFIAIGMGHGSWQGVVVVWDRSIFQLLCTVRLPGYEKKMKKGKIQEERRENIDYVHCVRIVEDFIIAGGFDGTLIAFSTKSFIHQVAPNQEHLVGWWGPGIWNFSDLGQIEDTLVTRMNGSISFMEKDKHWLLVISDCECALWDFSRGLLPNMETKIDAVSASNVSDCALKYPHAFFAMTADSKEPKCVEIWDIEKNEKIREILNSENWLVAVNENIFASKMLDSHVHHHRRSQNKIFLHDIEELVNPYIATDDLWMRTVTYPIGMENGRLVNYHIALNTTSLFVISGYNEYANPNGYIDPILHAEFKQIHIWDFVKRKNDIGKCQKKLEEKKSILKRIKSLTRKKACKN